MGLSPWKLSPPGVRPGFMLLPYDDGIRGKIPCMVCTMKALRCICLLAGCLGLWGCASPGSTAPSAKGGKKGGGGDVPVSVVKVGRRDVPINIQVIGNVEPYSAIAVKAQVGGVLTKVSFQEGDFVKNGDLLFSIDPRPLKAMLDQQEATLAKNRAQLRQAEANLARDIAQEQYAA